MNIRPRLNAHLMGAVLFSGLVSAACRPDLAATAQSRTVALRYEGDAKSTGAGLMMASGVVLTCAHVLHVQMPRMPAFLAGQRRMEIVFTDPAFDLAILAEAGKPWEVHMEEDWAAREELRPGDEIVISASPFGLPDSLLFGRVSHTNRKGIDPAFPEIPFIQVQGVSYPGTSGAPVFHSKGIAGIHRASYGSPSSGLGLVIPAGYVREFLERAARSKQEITRESKQD